MQYEKRADERGHLLFKRYTPDEYPEYDPLPHFHGSIEIFIVEKGGYNVYIGGECYSLCEGNIAFIDRFTPHTSGAAKEFDDFSVFVIVASSEYFSSVEWLRHETLQFFNKKPCCSSRLLEIIRAVYPLSNALDEDAKRGFITLVLSLLHSSCAPHPRKNEKRGEVLVEIMRYIGESYSENITLDSLSAKFGYEKTYISSILGKSLGMNLREYINRLRISEARRLIAENPDEPIYRIAEKCGYSSQNTFYRALKRYSAPQKNHNF